MIFSFSCKIYVFVIVIREMCVSFDVDARGRKSQYGFMWYLEKKFPLNSYCIIHFHPFTFFPCIFLFLVLPSERVLSHNIVVVVVDVHFIQLLYALLPLFCPMKTSLMSSHCIYTEHMIVIAFRWTSQTKFILLRSKGIGDEIECMSLSIFLGVLFFLSSQSLHRIKSTKQSSHKSLFLCFGFCLFCFLFGLFVYCSGSVPFTRCMYIICETFRSPHLNCFRLFNPFGIIYGKVYNSYKVSYMYAVDCSKLMHPCIGSVGLR